MGVGRNLAYKKALFTEELMTSSDLASGDDDLFIQKVANGSNTAICTDQKAHTFSDIPSTYGAWLKQKLRHYSTGPNYSRNNIINLALMKTSFYLPNILMFYLFFNNFYPEIILFIFFSRWIIWLTTLNFLRKRLGFSQPLYLLPWFEIYFTLFDLWIAIKNAMMMPKAWK